MAVLAFTETHVWHGAGWVLRAIAAKLNASGSFPQYKRQFSMIDEGWTSLDLTDMGAAELPKMRTIVAALVSEVTAEGPPEYGAFYNGFLARLEELLNLIDAEIRNRQ